MAGAETMAGAKVKVAYEIQPDARRKLETIAERHKLRRRRV